VTLDFQCLAGDWFFDDASAGCPQATPVYSRAAAQYFEHGFMIWTEQPDRFYVFFDEGHEFDWSEAPYFFETPEPMEPAIPPPGYSEPVSGFGRVWRGEISDLVNIRQRLGWATGPEFEFETAYQCVLPTAYFGDMGNCYLRSPSGNVLYFYPSSNHREKWFWAEVET
jgi:hypothetical protein